MNNSSKQNMSHKSPGKRGTALAIPGRPSPQDVPTGEDLKAARARRKAQRQARKKGR